MKNHIIPLAFVLAAFFLTCCKKSNNQEQFVKIESNYKAELDQGFYLPIDSQTSLFNFLNSPAYFSDSIKYLIFNSNTNSIDQYNLDSRKLEKRVLFKKEGPNSIQAMMIPFGYHFVNQDTVIFYSKMIETVFLANLNGEVYKEVKLSGLPIGFGSVAPISPIAYRKGSIYMQSLPKIPVNIPEDYVYPPNRISKIDLKTGKFEEFEVDFPEVYRKKNIAQQLKMIDLVYNPKTDKFVISFPLSDELLVTDFKSEPERYLANSNLMSTVLEVDQSNTSVQASKLNNLYYWMNSSYEKLIYDPANDIYIREARSGISDESFLNRKLGSKRELVVLDSDFQVLKRVPFESAEMFYSFFKDDSFFWNKDIQKYNLAAGVEDTIFFDQVKLGIN